MHIFAISNAMQPYASILFVVGVAVVMAGAILVLTHVVGPKRKGDRKDESYESGMPPVADARRRFNVRFYIVALLFLLFDVEVIILWPWALVFHDTAVAENAGNAAVAAPSAGFLLLGAGFFFALLLVGYVYEWRKGVFQWDQ
ncbi:MAG: NADH-quinone oxidoreductase subunit A [Phycisphaerae bacterium]|nr:MAG: NADH-quinone oxidoreductase subunit A [Phycisphaerae bacterium]